MRGPKTLQRRSLLFERILNGLAGLFYVLADTSYGIGTCGCE